RVRAYKPKVKTGCITCRIRRVKCDEEKPNCRRCTSTGRKCDGYLTPASSLNNSSPLQKISHSPDPQPLESKLEGRYFDFFCKRTVVIFSGIFDPTVWTRLIVQATHHEPAIRHAAIALGALHESSEVGSRAEPSIFAMEQYGKAIRYLVKPIREKQKQAADVALMTCVLFVCFEMMRGSYGTAISHIDSGVKIISELQPSNKPTETWSVSTIPYAEPSVLHPIFIRLDRQVSEIASGRKRVLLDQILEDKAAGYHEDIPLVFSSLEQARNSLEHIRTFEMRFVRSATSQPSFSDPVKRSLMLDISRSLSFIHLQKWSTAFNSFIQNTTDFDVASQEAIHVLKMHRLVMGIAMVVDGERSYADPTIWDQNKPQFESIISHATSVYELYIRSCEKEGRKRTIFYLDSGINYPLFFVAAACRDGAIRWKAIELLKAMNRQEGLSNSLLSAKIVEHMASIEE
ncbi:hypothetical protein OIDMADRAFT_74156, partial [Oidiodendron maius Zn]